MQSLQIDRAITADIQLEILAGQYGARAISVMYNVPLDVVETLVEQIFDEQLEFLSTELVIEDYTVLQ